MPDEEKIESNTADFKRTEKEIPINKAISGSVLNAGGDNVFQVIEKMGTFLSVQIPADLTGISGQGIKAERQTTIKDYIRDYVPSHQIVVGDIDIELRYLDQSRIIVLDSHASDLLNGTLDAIACNEKVSSFEKKRLSFEKIDGGEILFDFRSLVVELAKSKNTLLILITNTTTSCAVFFEHLLSNDFKAGIGEYRKMLTDSNSYIIIAVFDQLYIKGLNEIIPEDFIKRKHLPFLNHHLVKVFGEEKASALCNKIISQRNEGKWAKDDFKFYIEITRSLQKGAEFFSSTVAGEAQNVETFREEDKTEASKLTEHEDKLIKYASFVATNFEGLSLNEFQYVMQALLNDPDKNEVITNPLKPEEKIEQMLIKRWNDTADRLLRTLHLKEQTSGSGDGKILYFEKHGFLETFREEFSSALSLFNQQQFDYLFFEKGLLFNEDIPHKITENFIRISAEIATRDPDIYCQRLLVYTTFAIISQKVNIDFKIDPDIDNLEEAFDEFISKLNEKHLELEIQKLQAFRKIGLLIAKMYSYPALRSRVDKYFILLLSYKFHSALFALVRYLKNIPGFDTLYWVRQLLEQGVHEVKKEVYRFLTKFLSEADLREVSYLEEIKKWDPVQSVNNRSYSAVIGTCVIIDYLFASISSISIEGYGKVSIHFNLFAGVESEQEGQKRIDFLVDWLLNPRLKEDYSSLDSFFDRDEEIRFIQDILAYIIIRLKAVFTGVSLSKFKEPHSDLSIKLGELFIESIVKKVTKPQRSEIIEGVKAWRNYYSERKRKEATGSKENREFFDFFIKISSNIISHFNRHTNL